MTAVILKVVVRVWYSGYPDPPEVKCWIVTLNQMLASALNARMYAPHITDCYPIYPVSRENKILTHDLNEKNPTLYSLSTIMY